MLIKDFFNKAHNSYLCNTSYPLNKINWSMYLNNKTNLFKDEDKLSLYIHIPFCKKICKFCEYVKYVDSNIDNEDKYLNILKNDIDIFLNNNNNFILYGFDIGGGTPTSLNDKSFKKLMTIYSNTLNKCKKSIDFEPSIEGTFETINEYKIKLIKESGINRISLGIQTTNENILNDNNRHNNDLDYMINIIRLIKKNNINKINIDLMYGIKNQSINDLEKDLQIILKLDIEQVTLYEMRYNMLSNNEVIDRKKVYDQYTYLYNRLISLGFYSKFGQNTFSKDKNDLGLSSYLKHRMINNISYKGFGISAQSKSKIGMSYNIGKDRLSLTDCLSLNSFENTDNYILPKEELLSKYIAISFYYGSFNLNIMNDILKENALEYFSNEFNFLLNNKYIIINDNIVLVTEKGFEYYGAICALFYSKEVKDWLIENE